MLHLVVPPGNGRLSHSTHGESNLNATKPALISIALAASVLLPCAPVLAAAAPDLVAAELAFAKQAEEQSVRAAFLANFTPDTVVFAPSVTQGLPIWQQRAEDRETRLAWYPEFAFVASSADLGYTYGPFEIGKRGATPEGHGHFMTVWKRAGGGPWRVALDEGVSHAPPEHSPPSLTQAPSPPRVTRRPRHDVAEVERRFARATVADGYDRTVIALAHPQLVRFRNDEPPLKKDAVPGDTDALASVSVSVLGSGTSKAHDLGYAYGELADVSSPKRYVFLHVWRVEGGAWRLALDRVAPLPDRKP